MIVTKDQELAIANLKIQNYQKAFQDYQKISEGEAEEQI
jgi:hypothetical protein